MPKILVQSRSLTLLAETMIIAFMRNDRHIDPELFDLFLTSGVYYLYAEKYLKPDQIDPVDINQFMSKRLEAEVNPK